MKRLKKTVKIGSKRYKKSKPSELYRATVYETTYHRDEDGEHVDQDSEVSRAAQMYTLRELAALLESETGFSSNCDHEFGIECGSFDGDYIQDYHDGSETRTSVSFEGTCRAIYHLENHFETLGHKRRLQREQRFEANRRPKQVRPTLSVIDGGNAFCSRPSRANLSRVV